MRKGKIKRQFKNFAQGSLRTADVTSPRSSPLKEVSRGGTSATHAAFEFCWSSFADQHNTLLISTRRNVKLNKFEFGTPWLPNLLCKHWFTSSVWNFGRWSAVMSEEKRLPFAGYAQGLVRKTTQPWLCGKSCFRHTNPFNFWLLQSLLLRYTAENLPVT